MPLGSTLSDGGRSATSTCSTNRPLPTADSDNRAPPVLSAVMNGRRSSAAASAVAATGGATSSRRRSSSEAGAAAAAAAAAGAAGAAAASASVQAIEDRLLVPPATQGTKRKRGAPPEPCPFCGHCYTGGQQVVGGRSVA